MFKKVSGKVLAGGVAAALMVPTMAFASTGEAEVPSTNEDSSLQENVDNKLGNLFDKIQSGELTKEEAQEQLKELGKVKMNWGGHPHKGMHLEGLDEETKEQLKDIREQVEAGDLTNEEAQEQIEALGIELPEKPFANLDEETKEKLESIKEQVESGELTREEAEAQMGELGIDFPDHKPFPGLDEETKQKLEDIKSQVEAGEMTKEEAKAQMDELGLDRKPHRGGHGKGGFGHPGFEAPEDSEENEGSSDL